jgi:hypothetical protein
MQLARAAAARALAGLAEPENPPIAEPPALPAAAPEPAPPAMPSPARQRPAARAASPKHTDPATLFTRLAATVRDCIALESRLAGVPAATPHTRAPATIPTHAAARRADPRRAPLCEAVRLSTANHPDSAALNREFATRLDEQLAADPDCAVDPINILDSVCGELGIEIDFAVLPDACLFNFAAPSANGHHAPYPRATSPP